MPDLLEEALELHRILFYAQCAYFCTGINHTSLARMDNYLAPWDNISIPTASFAMNPYSDTQSLCQLPKTLSSILQELGTFQCYPPFPVPTQESGTLLLNSSSCVMAILLSNSILSMSAGREDATQKKASACVQDYCNSARNEQPRKPIATQHLVLC